MQDVLEASAFFADAVFHRDLQAVNEQLVGVHRLAAHFFDLAHLHLAAVQVGVEQAQAVLGVLHVFQAGGAGQQQDFVRHLGGGNPDFLALDHVVIAPAFGKGFELERVQAGVGLGHAKAGLHLAADDGGQPALLLRLRAIHHHRVQAEHIHVDGRGPRQARARCRDRLHHDAGLQYAQARAAIGLRHGDAQPAGAGHGAVKVHGKAAMEVFFKPVVVGEVLAHVTDRCAYGGLVVGLSKIHEQGSRRKINVTPPQAPWSIQSRCSHCAQSRRRCGETPPHPPCRA